MRRDHKIIKIIQKLQREEGIFLNLQQDKNKCSPKTILNALHSLGFGETKNVRVGKFFEIQLEGDNKAQLEEKIHAMCDKLLVNPVIEEYSYTEEEGKAK